MTRAEFLQGLRTELEGRVPYSVIQENIRYYDSYISDEISKGADEAEERYLFVTYTPNGEC